MAIINQEISFTPQEEKLLANSLADRIIFLESMLFNIPPEDIGEKQKIHAEIFMLYQTSNKYNIPIQDVL